MELSGIQQVLGPKAYRLTPATMGHRITRGSWIPAKHLLYTSSIIASAIARGNGRILISMPPRHGKTLLLGTHTPIWTLDRDPTKEVIYTSYGADLSLDSGRRVRDLINFDNSERGEHLLKVQLRKDAQAVEDFLTVNDMGKGGMRSMGIGGPILGRGADLFLSDDYIKTPKEAFSDTHREDIWNWFTGLAFLRLEPGGTIIIIAHRWHEKDLIGRLIEEQKDTWTYIRVPAIAEANDPLGREIGAPLWPERYDLPALKELETVAGPYFWDALYQQRPPKIGTLAVAVDEIRIVDYNEVPWERLRRVRAWDLAGTEGDGDYTVGALLGEDDTTGITYVLDIIRVQYAAADIEQLLYNTAVQDGYQTQIVIEQEPGASGKNLVDYYIRVILKGFTVEGNRASGPKPIRAQPFFGAIGGKCVRMVRNPQWNNPYILELKGFPTGDHDDQIDASGSAYIKLHEKRYKGVVWGRPKPGSSLILPANTNLKQAGLAHTTASSSRGQLISGVTWGRRRR